MVGPRSLRAAATMLLVATTVRFPSLAVAQQFLGDPALWNTPSGGNSGEEDFVDTFFNGQLLNASWAAPFNDTLADLYVTSFNDSSDNVAFSQLLTKEVDLGNEDGFYPWIIDLSDEQLSVTDQYMLVFAPTSDNDTYTPSPGQDFPSPAFYIEPVDGEVASTAAAESAVPAETSTHAAHTSAASTPRHSNAATMASSSSSATSISTSSNRDTASSGMSLATQAGLAIGLVASTTLIGAGAWFLARHYRRKRTKLAAHEPKEAFVVLHVAKKPRRGGKGVLSHFWSAVPKPATEDEGDRPPLPELPAQWSAGSQMSRASERELGRRLGPGELQVSERAAPAGLGSATSARRSKAYEYGRSAPVELDGSSR